MGVVTFNNVSSESLGLVIQFIPSYTFPEKEYQTINIPGRNGDLVLDKGSYRNTEKTYSFAKVFESGETFIGQANKIVAWLHSAKGYARLEDTYEPDYYRMAMYRSGGELSNFYDTATVLDVTFECKPQKYLKTGDTEVAVSDGSTIQNQQSYDASPVISFHVNANETATITIKDCEMQVGPFTEAKDIIVDCENKECYYGNTLYNQYLKLINGKFPVLVANTTNTIHISNASNVKIKPRWWTL